MRNTLAALALAAAASALPRNALATRCNRTIRVGVYRIASPASALGLTTELDYNGACVALYNQPFGETALARVEAGDLDLAFVDTASALAATTRAAKVRHVATPLTLMENCALVARRDIRLQADLRGATIWTTEGSDWHYLLLGTLQSASVDVRDVNIRFGASMEEIAAAWATGRADAVWCADACVLYVQRTPHPADGVPGHVVVDAGDLIRWGYPTGVVLVTRAGLADEELGFLERFIAKAGQAAYDYRVATAPGRSAPWAEQVLPDGRPNNWALGGPYLSVVSAWVASNVRRNEAAGDGASDATAVDAWVAGSLRSVLYYTVEDQIKRAYLDLNILNGTRENFVQQMALKLFKLKMIADDPREDPASFYERQRDIRGLIGARALGIEKQPLELDLSGLLTNPPPMQLPIPGEVCDELTVVNVDDGPFRLTDGSTGFNAYHSNTNCVWALQSPATGCVALDIDFLVSEAPYDELLVYASCGDLLAKFGGRQAADRPLERVAGCNGDHHTHTHRDTYDVPESWPDAALYVVWRTDSFELSGIGAIEPVGFSATAVSVPRANDVCAPGFSGTRCDRPFCNGIVDVTAGGATSGVIRSQPAGAEAYAPYSQCGWRIPRGDASRVTLTFRELALDAMFDKVKVFRGGPPDSIGWTALARFAGDTTAHGPFTSALDPDFAYQFTGTRLPEAPITVEDDVFISFESDGLANAPRNGGPAGFEIHWSIEGSGALCPEASCGHGTCVEGKCVCEPGYYGDTCAFDHCLSEEFLGPPPTESGRLIGTAPAGRVVSGVVEDYPPATRCVWAFRVPHRAGKPPVGVRLRFDKFDLEGPEYNTITTDRLSALLLGGAASRDAPSGQVVSFYRAARAGRRSARGSGRPPLGAWSGADGSFQGTFADGDEIDLTLPEGTAGSVALVFESDASNPTPHSGFDLSYRVIWEDETYCDSNWPCPGGLTCQDNVCHEKKAKNNAQKLRRQRNEAFLVIGCIVGGLLLVALAVGLCRFADKKAKLERQRAFIVRDQIEDAICSVEDFQAPFAAVAGDVFVGLGELVAHEVLRDRGDLFFFDSLGDVAAEQHSGTIFVFLSHQWLGHFAPDPQGIHYRAMVRAVTSTAERASVPLNRLRVWVDFASVPQANSTQQKVAIGSLPSFSSCVDYFVVVAPATRHTNTGLACDRASFHARCWCRAEISGCWAGNGSSKMYISTDHGIDKLFPGGEDDPQLREAIDVFGGNLTSALCCKLGHPDAMPCDREALVRPMTGLFHEIYRNRHGSRRDAWAVVEPRIDELYPRTFDWMCFGGPEGEVVETAPLFGDLIDATRLVVDQADDYDDPIADLARFTGFAPGTNAQRHILRVAKKGVSLLDILPTLSSPRTPWSTREGTGTPSPNTPGRRSRRLSRAASSGSTEPSTPAVTVDDSAPTSPV